jgi:hypothetical protein
MILTIFLSQLRICVEMAFGRLVTKWQILHTPLEVPLSKCASVIQACCHLHKYCTDERINDGGERKRIETVYNNDGSIFGYIPSGISNAPANGSILCQKLVQKVASMSLSHPELNIKQRFFEEEWQAIYYESTWHSNTWVFCWLPALSQLQRNHNRFFPHCKLYFKLLLLK